ncbi:MAG: hypothetical protein ACHQ1D_00975 [Nitrososphaerales archaeon]
MAKRSYIDEDQEKHDLEENNLYYFEFDDYGRPKKDKKPIDGGSFW